MSGYIFQNILDSTLAMPIVVDHCTYIPMYIKQAFFESLYFIPILFLLYFGIEFIERFFISHITLFVNLLQKLGIIFALPIAIIPGCSYSSLISIYYSRKILSRSVLFVSLIMCSDDALPLLFINPSKVPSIFYVIAIKSIVAIIVFTALFVLELIFTKKKEEVTYLSSSVNVNLCCEHHIETGSAQPSVFKHPLHHIFNLFLFSFLCISLLNALIEYVPGADSFYQTIDLNLQIVLAALIGLVPNCSVSVLLAMAYTKGIIAFPALLASLITQSGLVFKVLEQYNDSKYDVKWIMLAILIISIISGMLCR